MFLNTCIWLGAIPPKGDLSSFTMPEQVFHKLHGLLYLKGMKQTK